MSTECVLKNDGAEAGKEETCLSVKGEEMVNCNITELIYKGYDSIIKHENIPKEMIEKNQWCYWKIEENNKKVPYYHKPGKGALYADVTDKSTWKSFNGVHGSVSFSVSGVGPGFMLSEDDPYCLIDLDHCLIYNKDISTWDIEPWAAEIVEKFNSYTEISSSGNGLHIVVKAKLDADGRKRGKIDKEGHKIEIYDQEHMIAFTGWTPDNFKKEIRDCQEEALGLQSKIIVTERDNPGNLNLGRNPNLEDDEIIELGLHERTEKFSKLFKDGDYSDYISQSEADQALCNKIAFYTQKSEQIDRIFRESKLMREKWENREDYRADTISKAINGLTDTYQRPTQHEGNKEKGGKTNYVYILIKAVEYLIKKDEEARLIYSSLNKPYLWIKPHDHFEMVELNAGNKDFKKICFRLVKQIYRKTLIDDETFKKALLAIECLAEDLTKEKKFELHPPELGYRRTWFKNAVLYDLGNEEWTGIQIDENGYRKVQLPAIFLRRGSESPQVEPIYNAKPEEIDRLFKYIHVNDEDKKILIKAWICSAFVPRYKNRSLPQPHLSFNGVSGSGKTVSVKFIKDIIDPSVIKVRRLPKDCDNLAVSLNNNGLIVFDNIGKKIPQDISDMLCIAATRGHEVKRKLYTDDREAALRLDSSVIFTAIQVENMNDDLINRTIFNETTKFNGENIDEFSLQENFEKDLPSILGGIFASISQALSIYDDVKNVDLGEDKPRMLDFAKFGEALSRVWGRKNQFCQIYKNMQIAKTEEALEDDVTMNTFIKYICENKIYKGPIGELLKKLKEYYVNKNIGMDLRDFVTTSEGLLGKIKTNDNVLKSKGIKIIQEKTKKEGKTQYSITFVSTG